MSRPLVVYWNNQPTPYVVARFNAVTDNGNVDLRAWFDSVREPDRSWELDPAEWHFPTAYLPKARIGPLVVPFPDHAMLMPRPDVLITPMDRLPGAVAALVGRAISNRVTSRTLPVFDTWVRRTPFTEAAQHFLYRSIDGAKVSGPDAATMAHRYGLPLERTWSVTQSIDLDLFQQALDVDPATLEGNRRALGLGGCTFIYVGRLWKGKGVNFLIDAFRAVQQSDNQASLLILGEGSEENEIRSLAEDVPNVHFVGFVQPSDLPPWYALADVFVFPTLGDPNGLVVEEAMAGGLPIITTANAGDIKQRVRDGRTGFIVPAFDSHALAEKMKVLARDTELRANMSREASTFAERYAVRRYADDFDHFISGVLELPARRTPFASAAKLLGKTLVRLARPVSST
jgi:glycosyltransferase involved in cell wall biosynthesis